MIVAGSSGSSFFNISLNKCVSLQLLDELSNSRFSAGASRNLNAVATKLYDKNGCEITDVSTLEQQQAKLLKDNDEQPEISVWLSFGEPYICPFSKLQDVR